MMEKGRRYIFGFILFFISMLFHIYGYGYVLSGRILDEKTGKPIPNVVVGVKEIYKVVYTNKDGRFEIKGLSAGYYTLYVAHPLYGKIHFKIKLKRDFYFEKYLKRVYLTAYKGWYTVWSERERFGSVRVGERYLSFLPGGLLGDEVFAIQYLPGVGTIEDFVGYTVIRANSPVRDKIYVDGFPIDYADNILIRLPIKAMEYVELEKGLYPVHYTDVMGTVIKLKSKEPTSFGFNGVVGFDPIVPVFPYIYVEYVPMRDFSLVFYGKRTWLDWAVDYIFPKIGVPEQTVEDLKEKELILLQDYFFKITYRLFSSHRISVIGIGSKTFADIEKLEATIAYSLVGIRWDWFLMHNLYLSTLLSIYEIQHTFKGEVSSSSFDVGVKPKQYRIYQKAVYYYEGLPIGKAFFTGGYEVIIHKDGAYGNTNFFSLSEDILDKTGFKFPSDFPIEGTTYSVFLEPTWKYGKMSLTAGARYEHYGPTSYNSFVYRLMGEYEIFAHNVVYGGVGRYNHHPEPLYYLLTSNPTFKDEISDQFVLGYRSEIVRKQNLRVLGQIELFYAKYKNVIAIRNFTNLQNEIMDEVERRAEEAKQKLQDEIQDKQGDLIAKIGNLSNAQAGTIQVTGIDVGSIDISSLNPEDINVQVQYTDTSGNTQTASISADDIQNAAGVNVSDLINIDDLVKLFDNKEEGTSKGAEISLQVRYKAFSGFINYTYQVAKITNEDLGLIDCYSYFDQTHILRVGFIWRVKPRRVLTFVWSYYTPIPYTPIEWVRWDSESNEYKGINGDVNSGRFQAHQKFDIKYTWLSKDERGRFYVQLTLLKVSSNISIEDLYALIGEEVGKKTFTIDNALYQKVNSSTGEVETVREPIPLMINVGWEVSF